MKTKRLLIAGSVNSERSLWVSVRYILVLFVMGLLQACAGSGEITEEKRQDAAQFNAQLGAQYLHRGELDQAQEKLLKALDQDNNNALAHVTYANLQSRVGENASAQTHFERALELDPDEAEHRNSYGIFLCEVEKYDLAQKQFRVAASNPYYRTPEFALDNAGLCMLDANQLTEAEGYLREALRVNPQFANAYLHMADLMHRRTRLTVADAYYQRYQAHASETAESLWLGLKIKRDMGDTPTAESYATRLLNEFPGSEEAGEFLSRTN